MAFFDGLPSRPCVVPRIRNGLVLELNRKLGILRFRCNFGFAPLEVQQSICKSTSAEWIPKPKCVAIRCPFPPRIASPNLANFPPSDSFVPAILSASNPNNSDISFGTFVAYECANGTVPRGGQSVAQCAANGQWTKVAMACQKIGCYAISVEMGNFSHFWTPPGNFAEIDCVQGAKMATKTLPKCVMDGNGMAKWDGISSEGIKCQFENFCEKFDENPCGSNGICIPLNGTYTCNCTMPTHRFNRKAIFGQQCEEIDLCSADLWPCSAGICKRTVHPPGAFPPFECLCPEGTHTLYNDKKATENQLVIASRQSLLSGYSCITQRCQKPTSDEEQFIIQSSDPQHLVDSTMTIYCRHNANSAPVGPEGELKCLPNGQWNGTMPKQCQKAFPTCVVPVLPNMATKIRGQSLKEYAVHSVVHFVCAQWTHNGQKGSDYLMVGPSRTICLPTGNWSNDAPSCILPQCSQIPLGTRNDGMRILLDGGQIWPTDEEFGPGAVVKMSCEKSDKEWTMTCKKLTNFEMAWSMDELPKCEAKTESNGICDLSKFTANSTILLSPSRESVPEGQEVSFECVQPNYTLSDRKARKCVKNFVRRAVREAMADGQTQPITAADQTPEYGQLDALIRAAKPEKAVVFDSARRLFGWHASIQWHQIHPNGSWAYWPSNRRLQSFLITPSMDVSAGDWLSLSVEIGPIPCPDCMVWVSYFAGPSLSADLSTEHFSPLGRIMADPLVHSIQFFPPHSKLRIQISADDKSPNFVVERVRVSSTACPPLANFPRTPAHFENRTISAKCQSGKTMQLICSPSGNWLLPENGSSFFGCECPNGQKINANGKCAEKVPLLCHVCSSDTDARCISLTAADASRDAGTDARCESPNALCMVQSHTRNGAVDGTQRSGGRAVPFKVIRRCAERAECGIFRSNVSARESCLTDPDGIEMCTVCCSDDLCNGLKPRELLNGGGLVTLRPLLNSSSTLASSTAKTEDIKQQPKTTPSSTTSRNTVAPLSTISRTIGTSTTPMPTPTTISTTTVPSSHFVIREKQNLNEFDLDSAPPFCIDQQPLELRCASQFKIGRQIDIGQPKPTVIPWPTVVDNDPYIQISAVNMNISAKAYKFKGDETEIVWRAVDFHGELKQCVTKLVFEAGTSSDDATPGHSPIDKDIECPEWHIREVNVSAEFGGDPLTDEPPLIRAEYPPIIAKHRGLLSFDPPNGTSLPLAVPKLVTVRENGVQKCQFWYQTLSIDCPLWAFGPGNWRQFECVNEMDGMMRCKRRERCPGGRGYPRGLRELRCWRKRPGKGLTYTSEMGSESEEMPLIGEAQCLQEESPSAVTVSIIVASDIAKCTKALARHTNGFFALNCPGVQWSVSSNAFDFVYPNLTVHNFTAETKDAGNDEQVLVNCIRRVKGAFGAAFSDKIDASFEDQCPDGSVQSRHFAYHLQCLNGWAPNDLLRCEICPKGHFATNGTCAKCPAGTFAKQAGQTKCTPCPGGTTTAEAGSVKEWQCLALCPPGTLSANGLAPCRSCQNEKCQKGQEKGGQQIPIVTEEHRHFDCAFDGCSGHGKCQNGFCLCALGFVGSDCSVPFDLCGAQFCLNSAKCLFDSLNGTLCICQRGFNGRRCDEHSLLSQQQNESKLAIKQQKGTCNGSAADNEGIAANECPNGACKGGICQCNAGFVKPTNRSGQICVPINPCLASNPCQNGANCFYENGSVKCECAEGWEGEFCEHRSLSCFLPQNRCLNAAHVEKLEQCHREHRCGQNGKCQLDNAIGALYCQCNRGYFGEFCEAKLNPCSSVLPTAPICKNGGTCQEIGPEKAICQCPEHWTGDQCDKAVDSCAGKECVNGGKCIVTHHGTAYCNCPDGYGGENCQIEQNVCTKWTEGDEGICGNGKCQAKGKGHNAKFECLCRDGWTGPNCNVPTEECQKWKRCQNNGKCITLIDGDELPRKRACLCPDGFWGDHCENIVNYCELEGICVNNGTCESVGPNYQCHCDKKSAKFYGFFSLLLGKHFNIIFVYTFFGRNCEQIVKPCEPNPCANGEKCSPNYDDDKMGFECECGPNNAPETNCTRNLSPCEQWPNYCNGGKCQILPNSSDLPHCLCPADSMGIRCETRKSTHYDLHFYPFLNSSSIFQTIRSPNFPCFALIKRPFSLCFWLRFGLMDGQTDEQFSPADSHRSFYISIKTFETIGVKSQRTDILLFDQFGVTIFGSKLQFDNGRPLTAQIWHHICLTFDVKVIRLFLNGQFVEVHSAVVGNYPAILTNKTCEILLAENGGKNHFIGQLSQVGLYSKHFEDAEIVRMAWSCREWTHRQEKRFSLIEWTQFTTIDVFNKAQIALIPGICSENDCQPGRTSDCGQGKKLKTPPHLLFCPRSQFVTVPVPHQRLIQIHWEGSLEKMFRPSGTSPIVRFESNFRPGQTFGWGQFHVVYLAEDSLGNWAICEFDVVVVSPTKCSDLFVPGSFNKLTVHKFRVEEAKQAEKSINLKCLNTELVSNVVAKPPFYICDRLGQWDRLATFRRPFALPSCTPTENAMQEVIGDLHFEGPCDGAAKCAGQVIQTIENASKSFGSFCTRPFCDGQLGIKTECLGERSAISGTDLSTTAMRPPPAADAPPLVDADQRARRGPTDDGGTPQQTVRVLFDLSVNNSKRAVAPIIRDAMSKFGANFVGESTRLQCSNAFPQLHINGDAKIAGSASVAMASEPPLVQCATCAPGETWQQIVRKIATTTKDESVVNSDVSGSCVKCPPNSYKTSPGVHPCTPCKDDRITGGVVGCMREIDCYLNCPPGSVYCPMTDSCQMCAHGQFMPYSGRLQCIGCPPGTSTEQQGTTSADQCSVRCAAGEEMGAGEQCEMCARGTFRAEGMNACRRCNLGFTTPAHGSNSASDCSLIFCPPGHFRNTTIGPADNSFNQLNSAFEAYGAEQCVRCPIGWQTLGHGAKSVQECDQTHDGTCKPDEPAPCPEGMECVQTRGQTYECHNLPNMDRSDGGDQWRRVWIPMILALFAVFVFAILSIIFIKNRQKWLLMLNRNCPSGLLLCCKKITVDDLSSNEYTRTAPPIMSTTDNQQQQQQTVIELPPEEVEPFGKLGGQSAENGGNEVTRKRRSSTNANDGYANEMREGALSESSSLKSNDPLNEIRSGLMEAMNANNGDGSEGTDSGRTSAETETLAGEGPQKFASTNSSSRRPQLTVQTNLPFSDFEKGAPSFVRGIQSLNKGGKAFSDSAHASDTIGMRILGIGIGVDEKRPDATHAQKRLHPDGLVGLRCRQFDNGASTGAVPLRSSLTGRSTLAVNPLHKAGAVVPADQSAVAVPSYDDDDDAFFS
ncbi:hypothetical protein niasHT_027402 [Heterodera trifolii]|uniref:Uncharacterized protein n=1 Tax=Heterodera trifolii TaxID=157864 RepID=A0ABD2JUE5_9BILA